MNAPYHNKALPAGTVLREWRLEEVLGVGGFGIVYRGTDVYFGETVAIKEYFPGAISDRLDGTTVAPTDSSSEEVYELGRHKFLEEAKVLWNLSRPERHPNIVSVRSLFEIHGTAYMVMDFESGVSLSQMLKDGKTFDEKSLLALIRPIAEGLDRAHKAGVLHRDIKPANILVNPSGRPVLIDFGSARFESGSATNTKVTFYTPPYAAIEQYVKSYPQGPWTDIYALGVVLYQCVSGEKPPEVLERLHGGFGQALSAKQWPGYSRVFTRAVDAAMAIRPLERPQTISEWLRLFDLKESALDEEATRIRTVSSSYQAPVVPTPAAPVAAKAAAKVETKVETKVPVAGAKPKGKKTGLFVFGSMFAVGLIAAAVFVFSMRTPAEAPEAVAAAVSPAPSMMVSGPGALSETLGRKMDAVIAMARKIGRKDAEIAGLTDDKAKILAAAKLIEADAYKAGKSEVDAAALAPLNSVTADALRDETGLLNRTAKRLWPDVATPPMNAPEAAKVVAALQAAKAALDTSFAATPTDAAAQIDGLQQTLVNYGAFVGSYGAAVPFYAAAKRKDFAAWNSAVQGVSEQVIKLATVEKPWVLASQARKAAYQLRQDHAGEAKTIAAQMNALAATLATTTDLKQLAAAVAQAAAAKTTLDGLLATSSAAQL